jgi:hypothetical protein
MNSQTDDGFKERMKIATEIFTAQWIRNKRNSERKNSVVRWIHKRMDLKNEWKTQRKYLQRMEFATDEIQNRRTQRSDEFTNGWI